MVATTETDTKGVWKRKKKNTKQLYLAKTSSATWRIWSPVSLVLCPLVVMEGIAREVVRDYCVSSKVLLDKDFDLSINLSSASHPSRAKKRWSCSIRGKTELFSTSPDSIQFGSWYPCSLRNHRFVITDPKTE